MRHYSRNLGLEFMRFTKTIHIVNAQPGQILAENIFRKDSLVAPKNLRLTPYAIRKLIEFNITEITIYSEAESLEQLIIDGPPTKEKFKAQYEENAHVVKDVLNDLITGKKLDMENMTPVFSSVYQQVTHNYSLIDCINEVRTADVYTYHHSLNVSLYAGLIGLWLGLPEKTIQEIIQVGVLHDVGKTKVAQEVLFKPEPLTAEEFEEMKKHSVYGYKIVKNVHELNEGICNGVLMHHEKANGKGYPLGLTNPEIHPYAKIIAVADVYDALTSERVYKKRYTPFDTFEELQKIGYTQFDPIVMLTFLNNIASYYTGAKVLMNTNETGEIMAILPQNISKPIIKVNGKIIDLSKDSYYQIAEML